MEAIYKTSNNKGKKFYEGSFYTLWIKKKLRILQRFYFDLKTKKKTRNENKQNHQKATF